MAIWTNKYNLPQPLVSAVTNDPYTKSGHMSVTGLIKPPRMRILEQRHDAEITIDVSERLWSLLGQTVAVVLERADTTNHLSEEQLTMEVNGWKISGRPDLLTPEMTLQDYKVTSVYSFLLGDKTEWEEQLNLYALLYRHNGFEAKAAQIIAILRDWVSSRALHEQDYPQAGFIVKGVPLWPGRNQELFMKVRVTAHQEAEELPDDELPECTPEERWQRPDKWAVKKKGNKRAIRVFAEEDRARSFWASFLGEINKYEIEFRPGESVRCARFCKALPFCRQGQKLVTTAPVEEETAA